MQKLFGLLFLAAACVGQFAYAETQPLPAISFSPASPTSAEVVTAILPFQICAWTVATTQTQIDINYIAAPCAQQAFTDHIDLGVLAAGTHMVNLNLVQSQASVTQAVGSLFVAVALASTPTLGWLAGTLYVLSLLAVATIVLRARSRIKSETQA
jgi:hypothetical protein